MPRPPVGWFVRKVLRPPYADEAGRKPFARLFRARTHVVQKVALAIPGWPRMPRPLRIVFLADFHTGCHADDLARLAAIVAEAAAHRPDLVLHGGDFVNMMPFGGGRVPPRVTAAILSGLDAPLGRFAVLGNHDIDYGAVETAAALEGAGIAVMEEERRTLTFYGAAIDLVGIPDARFHRDAAAELLGGLAQRPTLVLAHDPYWFRYMPPGPHLMLAGHTHGGQIRLPRIGPLINMSWAPLRWSHGLIVEDGRHLYVTGGLGTSGVPLRLGIVPEYAVIDVTAAEPASSGASR